MSNKQPEFLVKGYHYTEYIEGSDSQKLCIDEEADSNFSISIINSDIDPNNYKLSFPSFYNEKNALKQNNIIEFVTEQMMWDNNDSKWIFYLPYSFKKDSLIHIKRWASLIIEYDYLDNYFGNYYSDIFQDNFEFVHSHFYNVIFYTDIINNKVSIQYDLDHLISESTDPIITYENITDFTLCLKGIDKFYFKDNINNKNQFKNIKSLWFVPHQDDEILTLGYGILEDIESGYDVHVILCTDGGGSGILGQWQNKDTCGICHTVHIIHSDIDSEDPNITREEFSKYRDFEFVNCCLHLGVKPENIHILGIREDKLNLDFDSPDKDIIDYGRYYRLKDGGLGAGYKSSDEDAVSVFNRGIGNAEKIVKGFINKIAPNEQIALRCMHPLNDNEAGNTKQHKDHTGLGFGVLNTAEDDDYKNNIINLKTFVEHYVYNGENFPTGTKQKFTKIYNDKYIKKLHDARQCYMKIDWDNGYHGVGYHSVKNLLNANEKDNLYYIYNGEYN